VTRDKIMLMLIIIIIIIIIKLFRPELLKEAARGWRKLHNVELHDFYFPPNNIRVIKSGRLGGMGK
jgi:hypothetical protein